MHVFVAFHLVSLFVLIRFPFYTVLEIICVAIRQFSVIALNDKLACEWQTHMDAQYFAVLFFFSFSLPVGSFAAHAQNGGGNPTLAIRAHTLSPQSVVAVAARFQHSLRISIAVSLLILILLLLVLLVTHHDAIAASPL